jgi:recombination protein RecT
MKASTLGLSLDPTLGEAYMIPFQNKKTGKMEAQFITGYKGLLKRVIRTGKVKVPRTLIIYEGDHFKYSADPWPKYEYMPHALALREGLTKMEQLGRIFCAVFIAEHVESAHPFIEVMFKPELDKIRARSLAKDSGPWVTDEAEMCRKSVARRGCKWLSMDDPETQQAITLDEMAEVGISQNIGALALGDDTAFDQGVDEGRKDVELQEQMAAPAMSNDEALRQAMIEKINARVIAMQGDDLSWPVFDEAVVSVAHSLRIDNQDVTTWGLDGLNLVWDKIKPKDGK